MRIRVFDVLLLIATIVGGLRVSESSKSLRQLRSEYNRVVALAGELEITDPALLHLVALESDDPWHFMWRVYVPANFTSHVKISVGGSGGTGSFSNSDPTEFIGRVRVSQNRNGQFVLYKNFGSGSTLMNFGTPEIMDFLNEHRRSLIVEQVGADGLETVSPDAAVTLLKISLPDELAAEASKRFPSAVQQGLLPTLLEVSLGAR